MNSLAEVVKTSGAKEAVIPLPLPLDWDCSFQRKTKPHFLTKYPLPSAPLVAHTQYEESNFSRLPADPPVELAVGKKVVDAVASLLGTKMEIVVKRMFCNAGSGSSEGFGVAEKIVLLTFISAVILMAILGNLLVMVAVCRDRQLRKIKTNYFIVSLAFADLLVSVLVMPFGAIELVQDNWIYGEMFCLVRTSLDVLLTTASILHLCCISLDRYYAICCQPLVYRNKMTPLRIAVMLGGCWVIPTFISFLPIMQGWNSIGIIDLIQQRQFNKASNSTYCIFMVNKPYAITCSVVAFYIPFLLMVLAYYRIYITAREHARQIQVLQRAGTPADGRQHPPDQHSTHRMKTETKAAKTLCIIMGCFCLCWAPFFITNIVDPFINYTVPGKLWTAFLWLGYINSGLNPFLYAFLNKSFRRAFLIILCCGDERYRRPSILGQTVPCSTTTINGSTHVLR
ncbi:PREDICTED: 5-hydroxytryptamine receptor 4 [Pterocles gutturalis]|uniref:5-hydroxytryptamine receptor 4 n=1 Tax=Pterocles gutturalis TaxID=240206 RepID=UPI00052931C6|nr:PREDICTED: 5-hydroxytryptamine receptor 4 [Pterocles gutturalis]